MTGIAKSLHHGHAPSARRHHKIKHKMMISLMKPSSLVRPLVSCRALLSTSATDYSRHTLNASKALKKVDETHSFSILATEDVSILQGIGPARLEALHSLGIKTIPDLANFKFFHTARAIVALAATEESNRLPESTMNINKALDKAYETKTFQELVDAPVSALQGISDAKGVTLNELGVATIADLAKLRYCQWAESFVWLSKFEE